MNFLNCVPTGCLKCVQNNYEKTSCILQQLSHDPTAPNRICAWPNSFTVSCTNAWPHCSKLYKCLTSLLQVVLMFDHCSQIVLMPDLTALSLMPGLTASNCTYSWSHYSRLCLCLASLLQDVSMPGSLLQIALMLGLTVPRCAYAWPHCSK